MDRRKFCKSSFCSAIAMGIPGCLAGCNKSNPVLPPPNGITAQAAAITGDNLEAMTRDAIDALGGMQTIVNKGDTVFITPNFVTFPWANSNNCFHAGECTKTEIILAVAEECLKSGVGEVIIGEGSHLPTFDWKCAATLDGNKIWLQNQQGLVLCTTGRSHWHAWKPILLPGSMFHPIPH